MAQSGLLQVYLHNDESYGYKGCCKVRFIDEYITDVNKLVSKNPYEDGYEELLPFYREGKINFETREMTVSCSCESFNDLFKEISFNEEQKDKMWDEFDAAGNCNFFIKEEDLKNRDFSKVEYDWQCS